MSLSTSIFDKRFKRFKSSLLLSPIIHGELLSITINCTEWILCLVEMFKMQLLITGIREPLYADNLTFVGLIATDFGIQAKVCLEITLACPPVSILYVITESFVWCETFQSELFFLSITSI